MPNTHVVVLNFGAGLWFLASLWENLIIDANYSSGKCGTISIRINRLEI